MAEIIVLEGGEGAGKGTVAARLAELLRQKGKSVLETREPGGEKSSEAIRRLILEDNNLSPKTEAYLFAAARAQLVERVLIPSAGKFDYIIIDRFVCSSYVYQGYVGGIGIGTVIDINKAALSNFVPDYTFYLDIEPEKGLARIAANAQREVNRLDLMPIEHHRKVREGYLRLAEILDNYYVVDADRDVDDIIEEISNVIKL